MQSEEQKRRQLENDYMLELVVTGEATNEQFDEVMTRVENDPEMAARFQKAVKERILVESLTPRQELQQDPPKTSREEQQEQAQKLKRKQDLGLGL